MAMKEPIFIEVKLAS